MISYKKIAQMDMRRFAPQGAIVGVLVLSGLLSWGGYTLYRSSQNQAAQRVFGTCLESYYQQVNAATPDWQKVEAEFLFAAQQLENKAGNKIASYCLVYQSEALLQQGDKVGALALLRKATKGLSASSLVYYLFKTKEALIMMDMSDEGVRQDGLALLLELAKNQENDNRDVALYYVGYHYWVNNKLEEAKKVWRELIDEYRHEKAAPSAWVDLAQEKLTTIL